MKRERKTLNLSLRYRSGCGSYEEFCQEAEKLSASTRSVMNLGTCLLYTFLLQEKTEDDVITEYGCYPETVIYHTYRDKYPNLSIASFSAAIHTCHQRFRADEERFREGTKSIPTYKAGQPILLRQSSVKITWDENRYYASIGLFSKEYTISHGYHRVLFDIDANDERTDELLSGIARGTLRAGESRLIYDKEQECWKLLIAYLPASSVPESTISRKLPYQLSF